MQGYSPQEWAGRIVSTLNKVWGIWAKRAVRIAPSRVTSYGRQYRPASKSVPQFERDNAVGRLGLVPLQTGLAVVPPTGQMHAHAGPPARLDRFHDVEP